MSGIIAQNTLDNSGLIKSPAGGGAWNFISKFTSDGSDATASFTSGIDSTYREYVFVFNDIHLQTHSTQFTFNMSTDGGSNYNVTKTSSFFFSHVEETGDGHSLAYRSSMDLAQSTGFAPIMEDFDVNSYSGIGSGAGILHLYNPSSTTFTTHWISTCQNLRDNTHAHTDYCQGYGNTTSAVNAVQFKASADEIQGGTISLFGITT